MTHLMRRSQHKTALALVTALVVMCAGCGLILDPPPPYPDQGLGDSGEASMVEPALESNEEPLGEASGGVESLRD